MWSHLQHLIQGNTLFVTYCTKHIQCFWLWFSQSPAKFNAGLQLKVTYFPTSLPSMPCAPFSNITCLLLKQNISKLCRRYTSKCINRGLPMCHNVAVFASVLKCCEATMYTYKQILSGETPLTFNRSFQETWKAHLVFISWLKRRKKILIMAAEIHGL